MPSAAGQGPDFVIVSEPGTMLRAVNHVPTWLFKARLGRLFGERLAMIVHRGRTTGQPRTAIVELCEGSVAEGRLVFVAAWGSRAQWIKNLRQSTPIRIEIAGRKFDSPRCRFVDREETAAAVASYWLRYPRVSKFLAGRGLYPYPGPISDRDGAPVGIVFDL